MARWRKCRGAMSVVVCRRRFVPAIGRCQPWSVASVWSEAVVGQRPVQAAVAQLVERVLGKDEVTGSIPVISSRIGGFSVERPPSQPIGDNFVGRPAGASACFLLYAAGRLAPVSKFGGPGFSR